MKVLSSVDIPKDYVHQNESYCGHFPTTVMSEENSEYIWEYIFFL